MPKDSELPEIAYYYPEPFWRSGEWVKNLLLFFDGVSLLIPKYMKADRHEILERHIAGPLEDQGLLHVLEPEKLVDARATKRLYSAVTSLLDSGAFQPLTEDKKSAFAAISYSRVGGFGDPRLADELIKRLKKLGLALDTEDGASVPIHPLLRQVILALLSQILRPQGRNLGLDLAPATDQPSLIRALEELIGFSVRPSVASIVASDLETVGVDLTGTPIDEVLDFRSQHQFEYRQYARSVRRFVRDVSLMNSEERAEAEDDRRAEIENLARDLKRASQKAWRKPATFGFAAAGAAWTLATGDPIGALLGTGAAIVRDWNPSIPRSWD